MRVASHPRSLSNQVLFAVVLVLVSAGGGLMVGLNLRAPASSVAPGAAGDPSPDAIAQESDKPASAPDSSPVRSGGYQFINPLLECERSDGGTRLELTHVDIGLRATVKRIVESGRVAHVSVYFRDLNNGPWIGINERAHFSPASLLKVPIMMATLELTEEDPGLLTTELPFETASGDVLPNVQGSQRLVPGTSYSVSELIRRMIVYSDNDAANLLLGSLPAERLIHTYRELGLPSPERGEIDAHVTVKQYSGAFRILYNATFLTRRLSNEALRLLSDVEFRTGIVAGVPQGVMVAHKFGERGVKGGLMQLHDCGIVYYPDHPYLLCVMTRGHGLDVLTEVIAEISRAAYVNVRERVERNR